MSEIQATFWDFAGVLLHTVRGSFNSLLAERLDVPLIEIQRLINSPMNDRWDINEIDDETFYTYMLDTLNQPRERITIIQRFFSHDFYIDEQLLAYIKSLKGRYLTVLLTNFPAHIHDFMRTDWIVGDAFDDLVASCDVKLMKPDPAMYQLALDRVGCQPQETVFIDDRAVNIEAAKAMGMHCILFENPEQTIKDMDALLGA